MTRSVLILTVSFLAASLVAGGPAQAHRQPEVETTVQIVTPTTTPALGITHRLHAHDAMTVLRVLGEGAPNLEDPAQLALLAVYAADTLAMTGEASSEPLGAEVEGNYVFVYVRHPEVAGVVGATFLDGIIPGWTNTVHAKGLDGATAHSVTFSADRPVIGPDVTPILPGTLSTTDAGGSPHAESRVVADSPAAGSR